MLVNLLLGGYIKGVKMRKPSLVFSDEQWFDKFGYVKTLKPVPLYKYSCGTIEGLYAKTDDGKDIIAVDNAVPHNGHFDIFLDQLEEYIEKTGETIAFCAFFNERLYWHLRKKRGYGNIFSTMDRLEIHVRKHRK